MRAADQAMALCARGHDTAFAALYDALSPRLFAFLRRRTGSTETAKDLIQHTFAQLYLTRGRFIPGSSVAAYAFAIARRAAIDLERRGRPEVQAPGDDAEAPAQGWAEENLQERVVDARAALQIITRAIRSWPLEQRQLFEHVHLDGL